MLASLNSWGTKSLSQNCCINSVSLTAMTSPPSLKIFGGIPSGTGASPAWSCLTFFWVSSSVGRSSRELRTRRWRFSWMAYWSIWDGLLRSWLRVFLQRWTISDVPVSRVPSEDGTGAMALEEGPYTVFKPSKNLLKLRSSEYCSSSAALCCHHLFFICLSSVWTFFLRCLRRSCLVAEVFSWSQLVNVSFFCFRRFAFSALLFLNQSWCFRSLCPSVNFAKANNASLKLSQPFIASFSVGRLSTLSLRLFARVALMSGSALRLLDLQLLLGISFLASLYVCSGKGELDA